MINLKQAVIVEGKYDKIKLSSIINSVIITTNGFGIYKDKEKMQLIKYYANKTGIIIMTDSDSAGFRIRNYLRNSIKSGNIINVYIPDIFGKEKRKSTPSAEGKLGVEGIEKSIILNSLKKAGITSISESVNNDPITKNDLYFLGLSGTQDSSQKRDKLKKYFNLPSLLSSNLLVEVLNTIVTKEELIKVMKEIKIYDGE